ncbi:hypothetical protein PtA15_15A66 [Puccinia triticina]|uniref:Uncharacterized protein n=1 Tax=Puccinia triticina TaxID=208348 RepID=A0ABY7D5S2_9BASI|nr:uncharacterized protein PtA15_15A66 [Puccinia triticina]WAQ91676.1 hypothetical protein PtA15_15A66 [Puccinia triticina]WAR62477.1 hypothetical protein PtB15_15B62 [Puccinia triticina]
MTSSCLLGQFIKKCFAMELKTFQSDTRPLLTIMSEIENSITESERESQAQRASKVPSFMHHNTPNLFDSKPGQGMTGNKEQGVSDQVIENLRLANQNKDNSNWWLPGSSCYGLKKKKNELIWNEPHIGEEWARLESEKKDSSPGYKSLDWLYHATGKYSRKGLAYVFTTIVVGWLGLLTFMISFGILSSK